MEQPKQTGTPTRATPAGTFSVKIENAAYVVGVHFNQTAKDTLKDKMERLMLGDVKSANFLGKNSEDILPEYLDNVPTRGGGIE